MEATQAAVAAEQPQVTQESDFDALLKREFRPATDEASHAIQRAVHTLAEQALQQTKLIPQDAIETVKAFIAGLDKALTRQVNAIIHHADFQALDGAWRGLHYLVNNTETDEMLKIRVMNVTKKEVAKTLKRFKGTNWDQSPLFKKVY